ncbi:N-acetylmuramoyl-L-alanine amidase family protein [Cohnella panacarvi]|uniref:N-acetylmuramoyl-L-alanine amidase family protein n=1 Tax=Cohnella panacarvi TaxID=400776 RepID=UPI00047BE122|nr:N-acetylmuramoyl-L-alanine amidase family protein [Cohnella panacarvi]
MKKWLPLLFVVTVMLFLSAGMAYAEKATVTPKLILDGKVLQPPVAPKIMNNFVMVPVRIVTESLGYKVDYEKKNKQVTVSGGKTKIVMQVDQKTANVDGKSKKMDMPPTMESNSVLIPLRFVSDSVGIDVFWDNATKSVFLYTKEAPNTGNGSEGVEAVPPGNASGSETGGGTGSSPGTTPSDGEATNPDATPGTTPSDGGTTTPGTTPTDGGTTSPGTNPGTTPEGEGATTPGGETPQNVAGTLYQISYESDQIRLKYSGKLEPKVSTLTNPDRLVVDFPNVAFADTFYPALPTDPALGKTGEFQVTGHEALQKVRYSQYSSAPSTIRLVLDLNQPWPHEIQHDAFLGDLLISLKKPTPDKSTFTVVLDAGHGGKDPGALSLNGKWEKEYNLALTLKVQQILAADERIKLVLTRWDDSYPKLEDRVLIAKDANADLFLSVHANSYTASTNGTETYYTREESLAFAQTMHAALAPATGLKDNGVRSKNLHVTRETTMPAALLEIGYLSSKIDEPQMWKEEFLNRVAEAIAKGIKQYLQLS